MDERTMGTYHIPAQHQGQRRNDSIIHQQAARWWPSQGDTKENLAREKEGGEKA